MNPSNKTTAVVKQPSNSFKNPQSFVAASEADPDAIHLGVLRPRRKRSRLRIRLVLKAATLLFSVIVLFACFLADLYIDPAAATDKLYSHSQPLIAAVVVWLGGAHQKKE